MSNNGEAAVRIRYLFQDFIAITIKKNRSKASEIYGSRIDYVKYVYEILFFAATAQMQTL